MPLLGPSQRAAWHAPVYEIIFEADTRGGKLFDVALLLAILASLVAVSLESVESIDREYYRALRAVDMVVTGLFTIEYILRLLCVNRPLRYARSFFGVIDLLAIVPGYVSFLFAGTQSLLVIRGVRLLRVFRVFKLGHYLGEARIIMAALKASKNKITVFLGAVLVITVIVGTLMYLIEGKASGFTSIPRGVYWAIVTMTTVGYGDIAPQTPLGQTLAAILMVSGYGILAVPTGIVTMELVNTSRAGGPRQTRDTGAVPDTSGVAERACKHCIKKGHDGDAVYCKYCGHEL